MDFGASVEGSAGCAARNNCRRNFDQVTTLNTSYGSAVIPIDANGAVWPNGLLGMPPGSNLNARMHINFPDPNFRPLIWTVRFNTRDYPGSGHVSVTRVPRAGGRIRGRMEVEASDAAQLAKLVASPSGGVQQQTDEGLFQMPFRLTIVK